jgi:1-acyl-sn-glycerol-3-phosphate acyltransferase
MISYIRSFLFYVILAISLIIISLTFPICIFIERKFRQKIILSWVIFFRWWIRICCGVRIVIKGNVDVVNSPNKKIYFSNHQGFIETLVLYQQFIPTATILKDVLLSWPIIGWALRLLSSIPINRGKGSEAVRKIFSMGDELLGSGFSLIYYPEGTRRKPGDLGIYKKTGAELALQTNSEIVPIVHNAGECWYGGDFVIRPGKVEFFIGDTILPKDNAVETTKIVRDWTERKYSELF